MPSLSAHATREPSGENVGLAELYVSAASSGISHWNSASRKSRSATRRGVPPASAASSASTAIRRPEREAAASKPVAHAAPGSLNSGAALLSAPPTVYSANVSPPGAEMSRLTSSRSLPIHDGATKPCCPSD